MVKKIKNRQKQNLKKIQKQKKRQERIKKQALSKQGTSQQNVEDMVDYALELVENGDWNRGEKVLENKSYIQEFVKEHDLLPEKT